MEKRTPFQKFILSAAGMLFVGLGILGMVLPLLPSTVFFLLAAAAFAHSSERLYTWLIEHKLFGSLIRDYRLYRAIPLRAKITSISLLWVTILYSAFGVIDSWPVRVLLLAIAAAVTIHILTIKTLKKEAPQPKAEAASGQSTLDQAL